MVGARSNGLNTYRKRTNFTPRPIKKKTDLTKEIDKELLDLGEIDMPACWKIYRLEKDQCEAHNPPSRITRNCRQNPYCLNRLGLEKMDKLQQSLQTGNNTTQSLARRDPNNQPCGLVNEGNFCYVNSFLQIWFNDLHFRQCIYDWRPDPDWQKPDNQKLDIQEVMNCLQQLFLTMQFTPFEITDAKRFIKLLRLDNEQQDLQEFHTLFFNNIERSMSLHPNGANVRTAIRQLFHSRIKQTMQCECGNSSAAQSDYRSIPISIDGFNSLIQAITSFFHPERLQDYKCSSCGRTGDTVKTMTYAQLPHVLIIQMNRYIYDNAKERHRKLTTPIKYPRALKADALNPDAAKDEEYELCAVMIHEGKDANHGHYYDIIRDPLSKQWFTYNDRQVILAKQAPGYEENKEPKDTIGRSTADQKGCYALVYKRKTENAVEKELRLPPQELSQELLTKLEFDFARQCNHSGLVRQLWEHRINNRLSLLNDLFKKLEIPNGRSLVDNPRAIAFIPTALLADLYSKEFEAVKEMHSLPPEAISDQELMLENEKTEENRKQVDEQNRRIYAKYEHIYAPEALSDVQFTLCKHGRIPLDAVTGGELKAVRTTGARRLIRDFQIGWHVNGPEMCACEDNDDREKTTTSTAEGGSSSDGSNDVDDRDQIQTGANLCFQCVEAYRTEVLFHKTLKETETTLREKDVAKRTIESPPKGAVWISFDHFRRFKKIATMQMEIAGRLGTDEDVEEPSEKRPRSSIDHNGIAVDKDEEHRQPAEYIDMEIEIIEDENEQPGTSQQAFEEQERAEKEAPVRFNEDIYCQHGTLSFRAKRLWLTNEEWLYLSQSLINYAHPIPVETPECAQCMEENKILEQVREQNMKQLQDLVKEFNPLLKNFAGRRWGAEELGRDYKYVLCKEFANKMRNILIRSRTKQDAEVPLICQRCLLCRHHLPYLPFGHENDERGIPLSEDEWTQMLAVACRNHLPEPIAIEFEEEGNGCYRNFCNECFAEHNGNEQAKRYFYPQGADIWVRKGEEEQPTQECTSASPSLTIMTITTRNAAQKNMYKINMRSDQTVQDLKVELMRKTSQSPSDQLLFLNDQLLDGNLTLEAAYITSKRSVEHREHWKRASRILRSEHRFDHVKRSKAQKNLFQNQG